MIFPEGLKDKFRHYVADRCGLYFKDHNLRDLEHSIAIRMSHHKFDSPLSYYDYLINSEHKEDEFRELLNLLTINHTYFFRNEEQFNALKEKLLPEIIERKIKRAIYSKEKPSLRIWSAGCSSGEEPYSIAILVRELIQDPENWNIFILASDASNEALSKAKKAVYSENSMKHVPKEYGDKYFSPKEISNRTIDYYLQDEIKKMVTFAYFNLLEDDYPAGFDIIFCRNVVIYFEFKTAIKVMTRFYPSLLDDGCLFIGYSETLQHIRDKYKMLSHKDAIYYCKYFAGEKERVEFAIPKPVLEKAEKEFDIDKVLEEISRAELTAQSKGLIKKIEVQPREFQEILLEIIKFEHLKQYDKALRLIEEARRLEKTAVEPCYHAAQIFLSQGKIEKAKDELFNILKLDSMFAPAYYLLGCIYMDGNDLDKAKENLRKAIYIDKDFLLAHFYLAQAFRDEGNAAISIREYRNTLKTLSLSAPDAIIPYSGGFNTITLMNICRDNLERLKSQAFL